MDGRLARWIAELAATKQVEYDQRTCNVSWVDSV